MKTNEIRRNYAFQRAVWHAPKSLVLKSARRSEPDRECLAVRRNLDDDSLYIQVRSGTSTQWLLANKILSNRELTRWMETSAN